MAFWKLSQTMTEAEQIGFALSSTAVSALNDTYVKTSQTRNNYPVWQGRTTGLYLFAGGYSSWGDVSCYYYFIAATMHDVMVAEEEDPETFEFTTTAEDFVAYLGTGTDEAGMYYPDMDFSSPSLEFLGASNAWQTEFGYGAGTSFTMTAAAATNPARPMRDPDGADAFGCVIRQNYVQMPALWLRFDGSVTDVSPEGRTTVNSGVSCDSFSGGGVFDGNSFVTVQSMAKDLSGDFTLEAWVKPSSSSSNQAVLSGEGDFKVGLNIMSGHWCAWAGSGSSWNIMQGDSADVLNGVPSGLTDSVPSGEWQHIAFVHYGRVFCLYIDGKAVKVVLTDANVVLGGALINIGRWGAQNDRMLFSGQMDEVRMSNIALYIKDFSPPMRRGPAQ